MNIGEKVKNSLESMGCIVPDEGDFDVRDYIFDSLVFVAFILELEEQLGFALSDEVLNFEVLSSFNGFIELIEEFNPNKG